MSIQSCNSLKENTGITMNAGGVKRRGEYLPYSQIIGTVFLSLTYAWSPKTIQRL